MGGGPYLPTGTAIYLGHRVSTGNSSTIIITPRAYHRTRLIPYFTCLPSSPSLIHLRLPGAAVYYTSNYTIWVSVWCGPQSVRIGPLSSVFILAGPSFSYLKLSYYERGNGSETSVGNCFSGLESAEETPLVPDKQEFDTFSLSRCPCHFMYEPELPEQSMTMRHCDR